MEEFVGGEEGEVIIGAGGGGEAGVGTEVGLEGAEGEGEGEVEGSENWGNFFFSMSNMLTRPTNRRSEVIVGSFWVVLFGEFVEFLFVEFVFVEFVEIVVFVFRFVAFVVVFVVFVGEGTSSLMTIGI